METKDLTEEQKDKIIDIYSYYFSIIDLMLADISNVSLLDVNDVIDELNIELDKMEKKGENKNEMSTNTIVCKMH